MLENETERSRSDSLTGLACCMSWFNNRSIQVKLMGGIAAVLLLTAAIAITSVVRLRVSASMTDGVYQHELLAIRFADDTNAGVLQSARDEKKAFLATDPATRATLLDAARKDLDAAAESARLATPTFDTPAKQADWAKLVAQVEGVSAARRHVLDLLAAGKDNEAEAAANAMAADLDAMNRGFSDLIASNGTAAEQAAADAKSAANTSVQILLALSVVAVLAGLGVGYYIARQLKSAAAEVVDRLTSLQEHCVTGLEGGIKALANGDLSVNVQPVTRPIANPAKDEIGTAATMVNKVIGQMVSTIASYNESRTNLSALVREVQDNATAISGAATSLRENSDQMAAATGQIAVAINEVTRSAVNLSALSQDSAREVERVAAGSQQLAVSASSSSSSAEASRDEATQIGQRIQLVASASQEVATAAEDSRAAAQRGQEAVRDAVRSMESIAAAVERASATVDQLGEFGQQIGDIVKAIDEIASQTNLLALNAAIEAARAGEQGRGFAVVAENVRSLAERSSNSTKEIAALIAKVQSGTEEAVQAMAVGVQDVEAGRSITSQAGEALESIIVSVQQSAARMKDIASEVEDLATGAGRIVGSAEQIAAMASESAQGANDMASGTTRVSEAIVQVSATSEETSASAEEVSASTEELSAQSEELAATASQLKDLAGSLTAATARFTLA